MGNYWYRIPRSRICDLVPSQTPVATYYVQRRMEVTWFFLMSTSTRRVGRRHETARSNKTVIWVRRRRGVYVQGAPVQVSLRPNRARETLRPGSGPVQGGIRLIYYNITVGVAISKDGGKVSPARFGRGEPGRAPPRHTYLIAVALKRRFCWTGPFHVAGRLGTCFYASERTILPPVAVVHGQLLHISLLNFASSVVPAKHR